MIVIKKCRVWTRNGQYPLPSIRHSRKSHPEDWRMKQGNRRQTAGAWVTMEASAERNLLEIQRPHLNCGKGRRVNSPPSLPFSLLPWVLSLNKSIWKSEGKEVWTMCSEDEILDSEHILHKKKKTWKIKLLTTCLSWSPLEFVIERH